MQNKKLTVVQIIDQLNVGGAERVLVTLSNLLYQNGHSVTVVATVTKGPLAAQLNKEIPFIDLQRKWKWNPFTMFSLIKAIKGFDIIHVHSSYNLRYVYLASKLFALRKPIFFHEHFGDIETNKNVSWHQRLIYPKTILVAVSRSIEQWALQSLKMDSKRVFLLPNTVNVIKPGDAQNQDAANAINLVLVANIRPTKNIEFAIDLLKELNAKNLFHLTIIGKPTELVYLENLQQKIKQLQITEQVNFIFNADEIQPMLHQFDLGIHTAKSESGPLVLIEYMAQGLPFITFNTGEVVQQIKTELPELIADDFNIQSWIEKIGFLLNAKNSLSIVDKMQGVFKANFSEEEYYKRCIHIYNEGLKL
ncbi:MAG TPA: glycosyltransferase family 4 protein [Panacibacter sp.]|nr:glycosyltransferase family 4 protein [Panacibacter sp.]